MLYDLGATNITSNNVDATSIIDDTNDNSISLSTIIVIGIVLSIVYKIVSKR